MKDNFTNFEALGNHIKMKEHGCVLIGYYNCAAYEGMVFSIAILFDTSKTGYRLDLQWSCFGLDFYGDTLQESYVYQFDDLEKLMDYLLSKYAISVTDIPVKYSYVPEDYPNPLKDPEKKDIYEVAWQRYLEDFKKGIFLDTSVQLAYASSG